MTLALPDDFVVHHTVNPVLFGGNLLLHRNNVGPDGAFEEIAEQLGMTSIRYPGGTIAEELFDIRNPDATSAIDPLTGDIVPIEPLSEVATFAAANNLTMTVVLPTRTYLSDQVDDQGHRLPAVDEEGLRDFVTKLVGGEYGDVQIAGLEIGNEYWGIGDFENGSMSTLEYARVAAEMTRILDDTLATVPGGEDVAVLVQMGTNYNAADLAPDYAEIPRGAALDEAVRADYDLPTDVNFLTASGDMNWARVANHIIIEQFAAEGVLHQIDGVIAHIYSRYPEVEASRHWALDIIEDTWGAEVPGIETWVTEWSRKASTDAFDRSTDYGLKTAHELVDMIGIFASHEVDAAYYWTPQHNTVTALAGMQPTADGGTPPLTAAGEIYRMLTDHVLDSNPLDLSPVNPHTISTLQEGIDVHAYVKPAQMTLYIVNDTLDPKEAVLDLSKYIDDYETWEMTIVGVGPEDAPGDPKAPPVLTDIDPAGAVDGMVMTQALQPFEILQVVIGGANFSPELTEELSVVRTASGSSLDGMILDPEDNIDVPLEMADIPLAEPLALTLELTEAPLPDTLPPETEEITEESAEDSDAGGGVMDMLMAIGLPLIALVAFGA